METKSTIRAAFLIPGLILGLIALPSWAAEEAGDLQKKIDALIPGLSSNDPGALGAANNALEKMCLTAGRPGAESERKAAAQALAARLGPDVPAATRVLLVRQLEVMGRDECVAALAALLQEEKEPLLRETARRALQANPAPQALRAIRKAYNDAAGEFRAALIQSLGIRKDALIVGQLLDDARSEDAAIRFAALDALAEIGDRQAVDLFEEILPGAGDDEARLRKAYLRLAESMVAGDEGGAGRRVYIQALQWGGKDRVAALAGLGRAGIPADAPTLLEALSDPDPTARGAARDGLVLLRGGAAATKAIAARVQGAPPEIRKDLAAILGLRKDPTAAAVLIALAGDADEGVRVAALEALGRTGGEGAVAALCAALGKDPEKERQVAEAALRSLQGPEATKALAGAFEGSRPPARAALFRVLAGREGPEADAAAARALEDGDPAVRAEAYLAAARRGDRGAVPKLLAAVRKEDGAARKAAVRALSAFGDPETAGAILQALQGAPPQERAALIESLASSKAPGAREALKAAAKDPDPAVRLAGLQALERSEDPSALPLFLEAAAGQSPEAKAVAIRGALRIADGKAKGGEAEKKEAAAIFLRALDLASSEDERMLAVRGLGETAGPEALGKIRPLLSAGPLRREAGHAAVRLAARLPAERKAEAAEIFREILRADPDPATARESVRNLRRLGVDADPAREGGMVTSWWVLGPIPDAKGELLQTPLPPEEKVDLGEEVRIDGVSYRWKRHGEDDPRGVVNLGQVLRGGDGLGAYLYAEFTLAAAAEGYLKMGSDDQIACFLNGKKVHSFEGNRSCIVDNDAVKVGFRKGTNRVLLKVVNKGGGWEACLRIADLEGKPLGAAKASGGTP